MGLLDFTPINGGAGIGRAPDLQGRHIALQGLWVHRCFSEDTDLTIGRTAQQIGLKKSPLEVGISRKERDRRTKALKASGRDYVHNKAMTALEAAIAKAERSQLNHVRHGIYRHAPRLTPKTRGL